MILLFSYIVMPSRTEETNGMVCRCLTSKERGEKKVNCNALPTEWRIY